MQRSGSRGGTEQPLGPRAEAEAESWLDPHDPPVHRSGAREGFEDGASAQDFFARLAAHWKRTYPGWTAWVLSPDMKLPQAMRLKESQRVPMWNGPIECRLFRFDMVAGSMRADPPADASHRA